MKCPKCDYLGFDTGDRCKNCGYDFSLMAAPDSAADQDLPLQIAQDITPGTHFWLEQMGRPLGEPEASPVAVGTAADRMSPRRAEPSLPLFQRASPHDDEPLVKLTAPRPPLAVRRTPENPRLRTVSRTPRRPDPDPVLAFVDDPLPDAATLDLSPPAPATAHADRTGRAGRAVRADGATPPPASGIARRLLAAAIDHTLLLAIDVVVIYFTLRMTSLAMDDWRLLPVAPMLAFLGLVKVAYFCAFTLVGGQTVGKMAARIQVVTDDDTLLDPSRAIGRTLVGVVSFLTLGLGFVPILVGDDRRALHDRVARTRVVALPSA